MRVAVGLKLMAAGLIAAPFAASSRAETTLEGLANSLSVEAAAEAGDALSTFIETARSADVVVLGEIHDNPEHHRNQATVVAALAPAALVFEMIPQDRETEVNDLRAAGADRAALAEALDWEESGWPDFDFYAEIMEAAPGAQIFGAGQPSADVSRAMLEGAAGVFGPDAEIYGLDQQLEPAEQAYREAEQAAAHCDMMPAEALPGMVEAQRFRDAGLADAALWARTMTGGGQVVVIAGAGHADTVRGMPAMLALAEPGARVVTLGQFESSVENPEAFDAVVLAPAPERGDPCAAFARPD